MPEIVERRNSFNAGEFSPWTDPRIDLNKYRSACREMTNIKPTVYGGAFSRPGSQFIAEQKDADKACRLIPFEFNVTNTLILEFGEEYVRFFTTGDNPAPVMAGMSPYEITSPYQEEDLDAIQITQQNDIIYLVHPSYRPMILSRFANDNWTLEEFDEEWPATLGENTTATTVTLGAVTGSTTMTASTAIFNALHVGSKWIVPHVREVPSEKFSLKDEAQGYTTAALYVLDEWSASIKSNSAGGDYEATIIIERSYDKTNWETLRTLSSTRASVQAIIAGNEIEPAWLRIRYFLKTNAGAMPGGLLAEIVASDPRHFGIVEVTGFTSSTVVDVDVIFEAAATTATKYWEEGAWSDFRGWPRSVTLHEDRLWFGGNAYRSQTVWASVIDDYTNFRLGINADLGLSLKFSSDSANGIQWIISSDSLVVGTTGSEWLYGSRGRGGSINPEDVAVRRSTSYGSAHIQPRVLQDAILFVQKSNRKVREFAYSFDSDGYTAQDMTLLAEHITEGGIRQITAQKQPETILWAVTGAGEIVGLIYERGQEVAGWFRYNTEGSYESAACVSGPEEEDELWVSVKRNIDGSDVRYIERFYPNSSRALTEGERAKLVYSDACAILEFMSPTDTISAGIDHLEGVTVSILVDGSPHPPREVVSGELSLDFEGSTIIIGIPYVATLETTWLETGDPGAVAKVGKKQIKRFTAELWKTLGMKFSGDQGANWTEVNFNNVPVAMDTAIPLYTGVIKENVIASHEDQASLIVKQHQPLPMNIQSLYIRYELDIEP